MVLKAMIQRLQPNVDYLTTFRQGVAQLDTRRNDHAIEIAYNNLLYYLVKEGHVEEALRHSVELPQPRQARYRANRLCVEGCIHLALGNLAVAEKLLEESAELFMELGKPDDTIVAILYLASVRAMQDDRRGAQENLVAAGSIGHSWGHSVTLSIQRLVRLAATTADLPLKILKIAFDAGGCLGPPKAEAPGTC
jgi:hypothetical protein